ncbi:histidinol-phosphate transaminase [bacterium]|nr:histidinol-phosphate transaminase [bacterium]
MKFKFSKQIKNIKPYQPGMPIDEVARKYKFEKIIKLASNENSWGFSPEVDSAVASAMKAMNRYPESSAHILNKKLVKKFNVSQENIILGNGSDDIIGLLCHGFLNEGDEALMPLPSFLMYEISVKIAKGIPVMVPLTDFSTNLNGLVKKISSKTRLIFITNPFNPTGATISFDEFNDFAQTVPDNIIIVVDEAYFEFVREEKVYNSLKKSLQDPRIVTLRTFSKAYGLAGFRIGYGIMDREIAQVLNSIRQPFNVNSLAQVAAVAAIEDESFLDKSVKSTHESLDYLFRELQYLGIEYLPTQSNFLMINMKTDADKIFEHMLKYGVIVRSMKSYGFDTFIRVTAGTKTENKAFLNAIKTFKNKDLKS